jgi:diguanylate cyclase (GGDEF)-like protein
MFSARLFAAALLVFVAVASSAQPPVHQIAPQPNLLPPGEVLAGVADPNFKDLGLASLPDSIRHGGTWVFVVEIAAAFVIVFFAVRVRTGVSRRRHAELVKEVALRTAELARKQAELMRANKKLAELATRDPLTGALNRRQFQIAAESEINRSRRTSRPFTLLLADVDYFKSINDRYGHQAGDEVLKELVAKIATQLRKTDVLARYGGEELILVLPDTNLDKGLALAERLRAHVDGSPIPYGQNQIHVTVSIGVTEATGKESVDNLLAQADKGLYAAKNGGRNRVASVEITDRQIENE